MAKPGRPRKIRSSESSVTIQTHSAATAAQAILPPPTPSQVDEAEIAEAEHAEAEIKQFSKTDKITEFLREFYDQPELVFLEEFSDGRIPYLKDGSLLKAARFYPSINLIVDKIPKSASQADIDAIKWEFERVGHKYTWLREGETLDLDPKSTTPELIARANPLKTDPEKRLEFRMDTLSGSQNIFV
jgi:hypothetical protein